MPHSPVPSRLAPRQGLRVLALFLPLLLSSCFTMALWGFSPETEADPVTGEDETSYAYQDDTEWSWKSFFLRLLLTPATLALDCVTSPVQAVLLGFDHDDDDGHNDQGQARCRRH